MPKLNDLQAILLATAAQRDSGSVFPLPDSAAAAGARLPKALTALTKARLIEERETSDVAATHRTEGDLRFGLFITATGLAAIEVGEGSDGKSPTPPAIDPAPDASNSAPRTSKTSAVIRCSSATVAPRSPS